MKFDPLPIAEYDLTSLRILASVGKGNDAINYHVDWNDWTVLNEKVLKAKRSIHIDLTALSVCFRRTDQPSRVEVVL